MLLLILFLFSIDSNPNSLQAHNQLHKESEGGVFILFNPRASKSQPSSSASYGSTSGGGLGGGGVSFTLSVEKDTQVQRVGKSPDLGFCLGLKKVKKLSLQLLPNLSCQSLQLLPNLSCQSLQLSLTPPPPRQDGSKCTAAVNRSECEYCIFHAQVGQTCHVKPVLLLLLCPSCTSLISFSCTLLMPGGIEALVKERNSTRFAR